VIDDSLDPPSAEFAEEVIRLVEKSGGQLASLAVARMDEQLQWFRDLPADQRSWVSLVAHAGITSFIEWLRMPDSVLRLTVEVFGAAPRAMARSVTLQQTVELIRQTIAVAEEQIPTLLDPAQRPWVTEQMLKFSREIAFSAARVYAHAAETRGAWDARLEALLIDGLVRGAFLGGDSLSQLAALGWRSPGPVTAVVGTAGADPSDVLLYRVHRTARRLELDAIAGVYGGRLVIVLGNVTDPMLSAAAFLDVFADGPVVVGPRAEDVSHASGVTRTALAGLRAVPAWPGAPRPVSSGDLLPERVLDGDAEARRRLIEQVYLPLARAGDVLVDTLTTFLATGGSLEATARTLFVHANTVRYRLRRVAEVCGMSPTDPRGQYALQLALTLGRLSPLAG
jgi:hypothetical protein